MRYLLPEATTGYELNPEKGFFSIVVPEETENLINNPSFELSQAGNSTTGSATISRVLSEQMVGLCSLKVVSNTKSSGMYTVVSGLEQNTTYTYSAYVFGKDEFDMLIQFSNGGTIIFRKKMTCYKTWSRVYATFNTGSFTTVNIQLLNGSNFKQEFYVDALQLEKKPYHTTYCDGDMVGFVIDQNCYEWTGTPHGSSSIRTADTRSGGREYFLEDLGMRVTSFVGLGSAPAENISSEMANGSLFFQKSRYSARTFSIIGSIYGRSYTDLSRKRGDIVNLLRNDICGIQQPGLVRYQPYEGKKPTGFPISIMCSYSGGMEGMIDNNYTERIELRFDAYSPYLFSDRVVSQILGAKILSTGMLTMRTLMVDKAGDASIVGDGSYTIGRYVRKAPNGNIFATGTMLGHVDPIFVWTGTKWAYYADEVKMFAFLPTSRMIAVKSDGNIYLKSDALNMWSLIGTPAGGTVDAICADTRPNGYTIFAGGTFTSMSGVSTTIGVIKWHITNRTTPTKGHWEILSLGAGPVSYVGMYPPGETGSDHPIHVMAVNESGDLVSAGKMESMDGQATNGFSILIGADGPFGGYWKNFGQQYNTQVTPKSSLNWNDHFLFYSIDFDSKTGEMFLGGFAAYENYPWQGYSILISVKYLAIKVIYKGPVITPHAVNGIYEFPNVRSVSIAGNASRRLYACIDTNFTDVEVGNMSMNTGLVVWDGSKISNIGIYSRLTDFMYASEDKYGNIVSIFSGQVIYTIESEITNSESPDTDPTIFTYGSGELRAIYNFRNGTALEFKSWVTGDDYYSIISRSPLGMFKKSNNLSIADSYISNQGLSISNGRNIIKAYVDEPITIHDDTPGIIKEIILNGITDENTNLYNLYMRCTYTTATRNMAVQFYKDPARTSLVAHTNTIFGATVLTEPQGKSVYGYDTVLEDNASGITGFMSFCPSTRVNLPTNWVGTPYVTFTTLRISWKPKYLSIDSAVE
jgi:hypothetical protein